MAAQEIYKSMATTISRLNSQEAHNLCLTYQLTCTVLKIHNPVAGCMNVT